MPTNHDKGVALGKKHLISFFASHLYFNEGAPPPKSMEITKLIKLVSYLQSEVVNPYG